VTKRRYDASGRRAAAEERRLRVADEAARLFGERGWAGTTLADVAAAAEVSSDLVSSAFGSKAGLLMAALRRSGFGRHVDAQAAFAALGLADEPSREARLDRIAALVTHSLAGIAPLARVLPLAADVDPELRRLVDASEAGLVGIAEQVVDLLAAGEPHPDAVDEVYVLMRSETYLALVGRRGWSDERFTAWLRRSLDRATR
jgi:AcrR family transcriptional regulator